MPIDPAAIPNTRWMEHLATYIAGRPLVNVCLPGAHNAASHGIKPDSPISPSSANIPQWYTWLHTHGWDLPWANRLIAAWSKAQELTIRQQLEAGIRFFDLRVVLLQGDLWTYHGLVSVPLAEVLQDVADFIITNQQEIILLHFHALDRMPDTSHRSLVAQLQAYFGHAMVPRSHGTAVLIKQLWDHRQRVIVFYSHASTVRAYPFLWSCTTLTRRDPQATTLAKLHRCLQEQIDHRTDNTFVVLQGILTPDTWMVLRCLLPWFGAPNSLRRLAEHVNPHVDTWLYAWGSQQPNIVIIDWLRSSQLVDIAKYLNTISPPIEP